jgi:hypothetical protein
VLVPVVISIWIAQNVDVYRLWFATRKGWPLSPQRWLGAFLITSRPRCDGPVAAAQILHLR